MTMDWALELQLSVSLTDHACGHLDVFHKDVPRLPVFPVAVIRSNGRLHPHDAAEFKRRVVRPTNLVTGVVTGLGIGSVLLFLLGALIMVRFTNPKVGKRKSTPDNEDDKVEMGLGEIEL